jgi:hypothetical protein
VTSRRATGILQQQLLLGGLLLWAPGVPASDGLQTAPTAHGPLMMLYLRQPLGARGATLIWGLRLEQSTSTPTQPAALTNGMPGALATAMPNQREIVELQIRHQADVRVEFGRRMTWNVGRQEFGLTANQPSMAIRLPTAAPAVVARALP